MFPYQGRPAGLPGLRPGRWLDDPRRRALLAGGEGRVVIGLLPAVQREALASARVVCQRRERQYLLLVLDGFVKVPGGGVGGGQGVNVGGHLPLGQFARAGGVRDRGLAVAQAVRTGGQQPGQVFLGLGVVQVQLDGLPEGGRRPREISLIRESHPERGVRQDESRV